MVRRQSATDRAQRLARGACPIHGIHMPQTGHWYDELGRPRNYTIVECPRQDCSVAAKSVGYWGPCEVLPEFADLMLGEGE